MLLQEQIKIEEKETQISTGYAVFLLCLYFVLNLLGQVIVMVPQMMKKVLVYNEELLTVDPNEMAQKIMGEMSYPWFINLVQILILLGILWLFKRKNVAFFSHTPFARKEIIQIISYGVILVAASLALEQLVMYFQPEFTTANQSALEGIFIRSSKITMFISIVIVAPITEEIMYRGIFSVVFRKLPLVGFFVCAIAFTLAHSPTNLESFILYFVMALGLGGIYYKTQRIEASIFAHMLNNFIGFLLML